MRGSLATASAVSVIIDLIIAAFFVILAASFLTNIFAEMPRASGAIVDATKVICFGGGADHAVHCLDKQTGKEVFIVSAGTGWNKRDAVSTPALTKDAIYFGLGNRVCAYKVEGTPKWNCPKFSHTIPTGIAVDETSGLACFGGGADHAVHCIDIEGGDERLQVHGTWDNCPWFALGITERYIEKGEFEVAASGASKDDAKNAADKLYKGLFGWSEYPTLDSDYKLVRECRAVSTPAINTNFIYFGLGNYFCKHNMASPGVYRSTEIQCQKFDHTIVTGIALSKSGDLACFGGGADHTMHCINLIDGKEVFSVNANTDWDHRDAKSTPTFTEALGTPLYFGLGQYLCEYDTANGISGKKIAPDYSYNVGCKKFGHTIPTGIAVDETSGLACFGGGADHAVHCLDTNTGDEKLKVHASGSWDYNYVGGTPLIENSTLFAVLGERICAFKLPITGPTNKDFGNSNIYTPSADPDVLWPDICTDFDHTLQTGIVAFSQAGET